MCFKSEIWKGKKMIFEVDKEIKKIVRTGFLKKSNDKKGHVFELLFSDELYNLLGEVKREVFLGINRSTFCFEE
jgi:hypothetical protein